VGVAKKGRVSRVPGKNREKPETPGKPEKNGKDWKNRKHQGKTGETRKGGKKDLKTSKHVKLKIRSSYLRPRNDFHQFLLIFLPFTFTIQVILNLHSTGKKY
jgi:hypothetical protein